MVDRRRPPDWLRVWGNPRFGDWDLDDMESLLPADVWEHLDEDMADALKAWRDGDGNPQSVPFSLLRAINDRLRDQGIDTKAWWAELYGR